MGTLDQPRGGPGDGEWVDVGAAADCEPGRARRVSVGERHLALFRGHDGGYHALDDRCPHAGGPLSEGVLRDGLAVCPWHGWRFDPVTGRCATVASGAAVATHEVRVAEGRVLVRARGRPTGA